MDVSNDWVTILAALIASFGGAPLFKFLAARARGNVAVKQSDRLAFEHERAEFRKERQAFWDEQRQRAQSDRLEAKTLRDAYNDVLGRNGYLEGQLARCNDRIKELDAELARLRGNGRPS